MEAHTRRTTYVRDPRARTTGTRQPWTPRTESLISALLSDTRRRREEREPPLWISGEQTMHQFLGKINGGEDFALIALTRANCATVSIIINNNNNRSNVVCSNGLRIVLFFYWPREKGGEEGGKNKYIHKTLSAPIRTKYNAIYTYIYWEKRINVASEIVPLCKHISIRYRALTLSVYISFSVRF